MERIIIDCPFCNSKLSAYYRSSMSQIHKSHSSAAGTKSVIYRTKEKYEVLEDCPNCHKSKKEIQKALQEGVTKPKSKEELKKQLEELGLSGKL